MTGETGSDLLRDPRSGRLTGVGVGPGDPGLLTRQAMSVLASADRVVAPTLAADEPGRAESVVHAVMPELALTRLVFDMSPDGEQARRSSHLAAAEKLLPWLRSGEHIAFVTLGDPNIYSTFPALLSAIRQLGWTGSSATVPGITAFQALAARSGTVLLDGTESLSLVTALDGTDHLARVIEDPDRAIVVYKGGRHLPAIAAMLSERGRLENAVLGERLGLPGEHIGPVASSGDEEASYLVTVIVPPRSRANP